MFSGLTNQVSSWMGAPKKEEGGEEIPKIEDEKIISPSIEEGAPKASKLEMLSNVKGQVSQMTSWVGSAIPSISGLRRGGEEMVPDPPEHLPPVADLKTDVESPASEKSVKGSPVEQQKEDDDSRYSATGGADSDLPGSEPGTPGEDKDGAQPLGAAAVSTKAIQGAKSIGNFLFSAVNKAGKTVTEAGAKIKKTVEENTLLSDFNKEQEAFIKEKQGGKASEAAVPPWVGCPNEENLKEEFLTLSTDRRNFVRSPPAGVEFQFDYEISYPVAMATLAEDPNLEKMRHELVPKVISEENFWRNYFYRVSLIRQANELSSMAADGTASRNDGDASVETPPKENYDPSAPPNTIEPSKDHDTDDFVSESFKTDTAVCLEEVRENIRRLGLSSDQRENENNEQENSNKNQDKMTEEDWERELEAELHDFEVVPEKTTSGGGGGGGGSNVNWEKDMDRLLDDDDDGEHLDLK